MNELFEKRNILYNLQTQRDFTTGPVSTVINGLKSLTFKDPFMSESCIEIKIELNFYFHTSASKGFMKAFKAFIKPFEAKKKYENKNLTHFFHFVRDWAVKG